MISVGKAAAEIITEVREQFKSHKNAYGFTLGQCIRLYKEMYEKHGEGNWKAPIEKEAKHHKDKSVLISTRSSVREMIAPGTYAVLAPLIGGFLVGPRFLMGLLAGAIASGCMLAIMMANAGGAWDNSKKLCEKLGLKKSANPADRELQKACVVGDTVGDPFKDTSGPRSTFSSSSCRWSRSPSPRSSSNTAAPPTTRATSSTGSTASRRSASSSSSPSSCRARLSTSSRGTTPSPRW